MPRKRKGRRLVPSPAGMTQPEYVAALALLQLRPFGRSTADALGLSVSTLARLSAGMPVMRQTELLLLALLDLQELEGEVKSLRARLSMRTGEARETTPEPLKSLF